MTDTSLLDQRAEQIGIVFHRKRTLKPFPTAEDEPLMEVLFAQTRPPGAPKKKRIREIAAEKAAAPVSTERIELPKGMVQYKRELWGTHEVPEAEPEVRKAS